MKTKQEAPRFHQKTVIPDISDDIGLKLVKYKGRPAVVPRALPTEAQFGPSGLTRRQIRALAFLENSQRAKLNEEALAMVALQTNNPVLIDRIKKIYMAYTIAVSSGEQYLASGLIRQALILQEFAP